MLISTDQWRAGIGLFYGQAYEHIRIKLSIGSCDLKVVIAMLCFLQLLFFYFSWNMGMSTSILGLRKKMQGFFSLFHWNVNSILAHNKLSLLETYNTFHKYDILCISETYLDSSVSVDTTLFLPGYNLVRSDHPSNIKRDGVCLCFKENLSLRSVNVPFLSQCVLC